MPKNSLFTTMKKYWKERFQTNYPKEKFLDLYTGETWQKRLQSTYRWSRSWINYLSFHFIGILLVETANKEAEMFDKEEAGLISYVTARILFFMFYPFSIAQIITKKFYHHLYDQTELDQDNCFPIMRLLRCLFLRKNPTINGPWTKTEIALAILIAPIQLVMELLSPVLSTTIFYITFGIVMVEMGISFALQKMVEYGLSPLFASFIAIMSLPIVAFCRLIHTKQTAAKDSQNLTNNNSKETPINQEKTKTQQLANDDQENERIKKMITELEWNFGCTGSLSLSAQRVTDNEIPCIISCVTKKQINELNLSCNALTNHAAQTLANHDNLLMQLSILNLRENKITGNGAIYFIEKIIALSKQQNVNVILQLSDNLNIDDDDMEKIAALCLKNQEVIDVITLNHPTKEKRNKPAIELEFNIFQNHENQKIGLTERVKQLATETTDPIDTVDTNKKDPIIPSIKNNSSTFFDNGENPRENTLPSQELRFTPTT